MGAHELTCLIERLQSGGGGGVEREGGISFSEGGQIFPQHVVTDLLVTTQQQKKQTSG